MNNFSFFSIKIINIVIIEHDFQYQNFYKKPNFFQYKKFVIIYCENFLIKLLKKFLQIKKQFFQIK